ncbi:MAG TPA: ParA family protein [Myxococcota bacterium]|nr:ParA family protein [Myxococcota bacterium]
MSRILDALRNAESGRSPHTGDWEREGRSFRVVTVASNKGGVGKTTLATNLAVYLRALDESVPILIVGLDDQPAVDRMFALESGTQGIQIAQALREGSLRRAIQLGQYGVHYVPSSRDICELKREIMTPWHLQSVLLETGWSGLVIFDTKSDFEILTRNAIAAADLTLVLVKDQASLFEAQRVFDLFREWGRAFDRARIVLSLVDLRISFRGSEAEDVLNLLLGEVRQRGFPLFDTFVSRSPKVESLYTNPERRALSILHGAPGSPVHRQMQRLAEDVFGTLPPRGVATETAPKGRGESELKRWLLYGRGSPQDTP